MTRRRLTLRTQLTLLYAVPFTLTGTLLVTVSLLAGRESVPAGTPVPPRPDPAGTDFPLGPWSVLMAILVLVSLVLGRLVADRFLRPVRAITTTARDISANDLHRRLGDIGGSDEFAQLAATLDDLFQRLETAFAAQRQFIANASHELRTPLTAERALLQVALADPDITIGSLQEACREVLQLGAAQERLLEALFALAGGEQGVESRHPCDLAELTRGVLATRAPDDRTVEARLDPAPLSADPRLLRSLIANLVDNAVRHNVPGGRVEVTTSTAGGAARLVVRNSGPVVPPDDVDRLFQPFQQLHRQRTGHGDGHGLGLAIVRAIATAHHAALVATAPPTGGLDITVTFP
ncbi:ATP-binding protein [Actinoplanes sichuanensis]|uniref:histidine kinase n=1 Tax=Actinoplanes sichuanensis TaxID=512349 RepID=A0ABW4AT78_9ACTN|nr:HAMP domain-containing sensor histidine kinase [Actinoplanes sichuanensis]BEL05254.1 ATP-binding protein [Actinoplanes sichuanensis]